MLRVWRQGPPRPPDGLLGQGPPGTDPPAAAGGAARSCRRGHESESVLWDPTMPTTTEDLAGVRAAARALGLQLKVVEAGGSGDYDGAFAAMASERADALVTTGSPTFIQDRSHIVSLAAKRRLPAAYGLKEDAEAEGAKPADLPVEQPTRFELVINLKTAKALGLTIPQSLLQRADQVIE